MSSNQSQLSVGVWLSVKKWNEMKSKGLFDPNSIMSAPQLLHSYIRHNDNNNNTNNDNSTTNDTLCPVQYHQLQLDHQSILSQQQHNDDNNTKIVTSAKIDQFDVLLHKNSETMANSIYFQIQENILEYSSLLYQIEQNMKLLSQYNRKLIIVDDFTAVEKTLDRCSIYNFLMQYFPIGEGQTFNSIPIENKSFLQTPLHIYLPPSVLLYQPLQRTITTIEQAQNYATTQQFDITNNVNINNYQQLPLLPQNALTPEQVAQYPLFFNQYGDGLSAQYGSNSNLLKPSILCLKSTLSSGSSISHAMVLSHNAIPAINNNNDDNNNNDNNTNNTITPIKYQPPSILYTLPPGLHLLTHVSPHHKVYKVYVIGDIVEIECRDSIDINGIYKQELLSFQAKQFQQLCSFATEVYNNMNNNNNNDDDNGTKSTKTIDDLKLFSQQLQKEYQQFQSDLTTKQHKQQSQSQSPIALYFNSQYMKMHIYHGSTPNDLLQPSSSSSTTTATNQSTSISIPTLSNDIIEKYLLQVLDGSVQPLLSLFPNQSALSTSTTPTEQESLSSTTQINPLFSNDDLFPSINTLYPDTNPRYPINNKPIQSSIQLSQRTVIPPYLPSSQTFEHALLESVVTSSKAWKDHISIRKLLKTLWTVDDEQNNNNDNNNNTTKTINKEQNEFKIHPLIDLTDNNNQDTKDFKQTLEMTAKLLQKHVGLTLFGFDVVQNYYTKSLSIIDVNYFPSYTAVKNLPTRVALEILKKSSSSSSE